MQLRTTLPEKAGWRVNPYWITSLHAVKHKAYASETDYASLKTTFELETSQNTLRIFPYSR